tara:strand:- start:6168 stop:7319 length:1152 start_codon:yes stop_codon:yes gene_type:complete
MDKKFRIFVVAGEKSGDELGGGLLKQLKLVYHDIEILGVGGPKMIAQGLNPIFDMKLISIMGLIEIVTKIPRIFSLLKLTEKKIIDYNPDVLLTIDSPGFNFRLQSRVRGLNIKQVHYVAPSVWAWKSYRAKKISSYLDLLLVLYPFEKKYFTKFGLKTIFVGHPIAFDEKYYLNKYKCEKSLLDKNLKKVALLPGSRLSEINKLLPIFIDTALMLKERNNKIKFYIVTLSEYKKHIVKMFKQEQLDYYVTDNEDEKYNIYSKVDFALCASGTVTMELAKAYTPMLVVYKLNSLTWLIVKFMTKVRTATILNLVLGNNIIPELFQSDVSVEKIFRIANNYLNDDKLKKYQIEQLRLGISKIKNLNMDPSSLAVNSIVKMLNKN